MTSWRRSHDLTVVLLAFAAGTTDVLSFLALFGTFTSAMTGNTALLGLAIGEGRLGAAERSFTALCAFVAGVVIGTLPRFRSGNHANLCAILSLEAICLASFTVIWFAWPDSHQPPLILIVIVLSAVGMGLQSVAARRINLPGIPTVVFTSTLTGIVMAMVEALMRRGPFPFDVQRQLAVFGAYLVGALLAGIAGSINLGLLVILPLAAVAIALASEYQALSAGRS